MKVPNVPAVSHADALVSVLPLTGLGRALAYRVPEVLRERVQMGSLVRIPLGRRVELGIVERWGSDDDVPPARLKFIYQLVQDLPVLSADLLALASWMRDYYAAPLESVLEVMVPVSVRKGMKPLARTTVEVARPASAVELTALRRQAPQQARAYEFLAAQVTQAVWERALILKRLDISASVLEGLVKKGLLREGQVTTERSAYDDDLAQAEHVTAQAITLNEEQQAALEALKVSLATRSYQAHLLHGVTGSGKTEVYLGAMQEVLAEGGGVIMLVPEVALTPQMAGRLRARLETLSGARAVVWHSHLAEGERTDAWRAVASGQARVVIGARSAIFAPVPNLRLIVVDEEHEPAYKQEDSPRYHARDVAAYRAKLNDALIVFGSATPSLESLFNVEVGKYRLNRLNRRIDDRQLPVMHLVDMRRAGGHAQRFPGFSPFLTEKLQERFDQGEQSILFLNRRGYDTSLRCPSCGWVAHCDHCDITLTHHREAGELRCHLCGAVHSLPSVCPQCRSPQLQYRGLATQKVEEVAKRLLPKARIVRLDADTMQKRHRFREVLGEFRRGKIDVLVGTQMIAKGLDFPNVTLVGLIDADLSLHLPDFRAAERTFQLLVQVSGRAGRGERAGEVVVQTYLPHSPPIQYARQQDFDGFLQEELQHRKEFGYPPYRHLIHHLFRGPNPEKVAFYAEQWAKRVEAEIVPEEPSLELRGPAPCPVEKIQDHYRFQLWYFTPQVSRLIPKLAALREGFPWDKDVIEVLDVDAVNLL